MHALSLVLYTDSYNLTYPYLPGWAPTNPQGFVCAHNSKNTSLIEVSEVVQSRGRFIRYASLYCHD